MSRTGALAVNHTAQFNFCWHTVFPMAKPEGVQAITLQKASDDVLEYRPVWRDASSGTGLGNLILLIFHVRHATSISPTTAVPIDSSLEYMGAWGVQITLARYLVEGLIDIGLHEEELPYLAWAAFDTSTTA